MRPDRFSVSVPASSANLGPGFDAVGIALSPRMRAVVEPAPAFSLTFVDNGEAPTHDGLSSLMTQAMRHVDQHLPSVRVELENEIPLGKGMGSSAAAIVLAIAVAMRARGNRPNTRLLAQIACKIEGHPDNALAAVFGGAIVANDSEHYLRFPCSQQLRPLLVVPDVELLTQSARALLPDMYSRADMVFTAQRASLLGAALASGSWRALSQAMQDRIHQPYRAKHIPGLAQALAVHDSHLAGAALSGAGPSILALVKARGDWKRVAKKFTAAFERAGVPARALPLKFSARGLDVRTLAAEAAHAA